MATLRKPSLPDTEEGTVQNYFVSTFIPKLRERKVATCKINMATSVVRDLHEFARQKGLAWTDFTDRRATEFLKWCQHNRGGRKPLKASVVNQSVRDLLIQVSKSAKAEGVTEFRLEPATVNGWKRPTKKLQAAEVPAAPVVQLRGPGEFPVVLGVEVALLTAAQYDVVQALVNATQPLTKDQLDVKSARTGTPTVLARLCKKNASWGQAIVLPGTKRGGYRLRKPK